MGKRPMKIPLVNIDIIYRPVETIDIFVQKLIIGSFS